jgi:antitoxin (DNA-binding transcriptional repressor) of toxin-antitoxin stability system
MELSVREARAQFAFALEAAQRGERVTITKNGKAVAELGPPGPARVNPLTPERVEEVRRELGLDKLPPDTRTNEEWFADFNDPIYTRMMLGEHEDSDADEDRNEQPR